MLQTKVAVSRQLYLHTVWSFPDPIMPQPDTPLARPTFLPARAGPPGTATASGQPAYRTSLQDRSRCTGEQVSPSPRACTP